MKYLICFFIWTSCLFFVLPNAFAQEDLVELTKKVTRSIERNKNTNLHIKYIQTSTTRNKYDTPQRVEVELKQKGLVESMRSEYMDFFADSKKAYAVYKRAKKILVMKDVEEAKKQVQGVSLEEVLNQLWATASISELKLSTSDTRRLVIIPSEEMQALTKSVRLDVEFDAKTLQLKRIVLKMMKQSAIQQIEFKYLILDKSAKVKLFESATSEIFDSNGKLLKKYEGFSVVEV